MEEGDGLRVEVVSAGVGFKTGKVYMKAEGQPRSLEDLEDYAGQTIKFNDNGPVIIVRARAYKDMCLIVVKLTREAWARVSLGYPMRGDVEFDLKLEYPFTMEGEGVWYSSGIAGYRKKKNKKKKKKKRKSKRRTSKRTSKRKSKRTSKRKRE